MADPSDLLEAWTTRWLSAGGRFYRNRDGGARFAVLNHMDDNADMRRSSRAVLNAMLADLTADQRRAVLNAQNTPTGDPNA